MKTTWWWKSKRGEMNVQMWKCADVKMKNSDTFHCSLNFHLFTFNLLSRSWRYGICAELIFVTQCPQGFRKGRNRKFH